MQSIARKYLLPLGLVLGLGSGAAVYLLARTQEDPELWLASARTRQLEARVSNPRADRHRPYDLPRAGPSTSPPPPLSALAALERRGDTLGIATAYLIRGQLAEAEPYLARAGSSPEADSDRAIIA